MAQAKFLLSNIKTALREINYIAHRMALKAASNKDEAGEMDEDIMR